MPEFHRADRGLARAREIRLSDEDRDAIDGKFAGTLLRVPRAQRRAGVRTDGDVVLVMGMPGAGKSMIARDLGDAGYERLNRDESGGTLADLVPRLAETLRGGRRNVVLDNTYPSRASRNAVIETAWAAGVAARCIWVTTPLGDAQVNAIRRMVAAHGSLPTPEAIRERSRHDPRYLLPDALFRYERTVEPPVPDEGFESVQERTPGRIVDFGDRKALVIDIDDVRNTPSSLDLIARYQRAGWLVFAHAWRPQVARGEVSSATVDREIAGVLHALPVEAALAFCPHEAGPPLCWCRKPIPGQLIEFAMRRGVSLSRSIIVGSSTADRTMAERIGARYLVAFDQEPG